jgi:hypothetical protein
MAQRVTSVFGRHRQSRATGADIQHVDRLIIFVLGDRSAALYQRLQRLESEISLDWLDAPSSGGPARSSAGLAVAMDGG